MGKTCSRNAQRDSRSVPVRAPQRATTAPAASLAGVRAGETVVIESILFGSLRELCAHLGLHPGDKTRCHANGPGFLYLEAPDGRTISLELDWARFIAVRRTSSATLR